MYRCFPSKTIKTCQSSCKYMVYVCLLGIFEIIINALYIIGRVDLRFYRPDVLPAAVRSIVTAEQTYYPSSDEEEDGFHRDRPETYGKLRGRAEYGHATPNRHPAYGREDQELAFDDDEDDYFEDIDSQEWDFGGAKEKVSSSTEDTGQHPFGITQQDKKTNLHTQFIIVINNMQDLMTIMNLNSTFRFVHILRCY